MKMQDKVPTPMPTKPVKLRCPSCRVLTRYKQVRASGFVPKYLTCHLCDTRHKTSKWEEVAE